MYLSLINFFAFFSFSFSLFTHFSVSQREILKEGKENGKREREKKTRRENGLLRREGHQGVLFPSLTSLSFSSLFSLVLPLFHFPPVSLALWKKESASGVAKEMNEEEKGII